MWAVGVYDLNLSDEEFWRLTLGEFNALSKRHADGEKRSAHRAASIIAAIYNTIPRKKGKKAFTPNDFLPDSMRIKDKPRKKQTPEEMLAMVKAMHHAFTGEVRA